MGHQTRPFFPTTRQRLPPITPTSPSTIQSIKESPLFLKNNNGMQQTQDSSLQETCPCPQIPSSHQNYDFISPQSLFPFTSPLSCTLTTSHFSTRPQRRLHPILTTTSLHCHQQPSFSPWCLQINHQLYGLIPQLSIRGELHQSLLSTIPFYHHAHQYFHQLF